MNAYNQTRKQYLPKNIKVLFVAEAVPDDPERFFYNPDVQSNDWLFIELMKALYSNELLSIDTAYIRKIKASLLNAFRTNGYYLLDAIDAPVPSSTPHKHRKQLVSNNAGRKIVEIERLLKTNGDSNTKIILIKATVFGGLYDELVYAGLPVINQKPIPFPSSGQQKKFREYMAEALSTVHGSNKKLLSKEQTLSQLAQDPMTMQIILKYLKPVLKQSDKEALASIENIHGTLYEMYQHNMGGGIPFDTIIALMHELNTISYPLD